MATTNTRDTNINIRARSDQKALIDRASNLLGKNRSDFMLDLAYERALDVIMDQRIIPMNTEDFEAFAAALDAPPRDNPKLNALMARKALWEEA